MRLPRPRSPLAHQAEAAAEARPEAPEALRAALVEELAAALGPLLTAPLLREDDEHLSLRLLGRAAAEGPTELGLALLELPWAGERVVWTDGGRVSAELLRVDGGGWILARVELDLEVPGAPAATLDSPPEAPG